MQTDLQLNRKKLPTLNNKSQPIASLFQLIRNKKAELSKQLEQLDVQEISLPPASHDKQEPPQNVVIIPSCHEGSDPEENDNTNQPSNDFNVTPSNKYKTILDQMALTDKSKTNRQQQRPLWQKQEPKPSSKMFSIKTYSRTRTEAKDKQQKRRLTNISTSIQKPKIPKQLPDNTLAYESSINKFCTLVQQIPKNMKMRNEDNLTDTIAELETFNPFFNRNNRIINVCLLKMGRIVIKQAPCQLYKAAEELDYFYIVLLGKVKLVEGAFKRVCESGQTILEEIIFSEKARKLSLERAKVINTAYLLQMKIQDFKKLKEELTHYGLRLNYQQMESIIKRNFIIKNWMRNKKGLQLYK